jgi:hypothetical protein
MTLTAGDEASGDGGRVLRSGASPTEARAHDGDASDRPSPPSRPPASTPACVASWGLLLGLLLAAVLAPRAEAQDVRLAASVDTALVGERFELTVAVTHTFAAEVVFPTPEAGPMLFGDLVPLARGPVRGRYRGTAAPGVRTDSVTYEVAAFGVDRARVPAFSVEIVSQGDTAVVAAEPFVVPLRSVVPPEGAGLRGFGPLATFPGPWWPWVLLAVAIIGLVALLVYWWRTRPRAPAPAPVEGEVPAPQPPDPPHKIALRALRFLEINTDLGDREHLKPFYVEMADVLRTYLAKRLGVPARERTTAELVRLLRRRPEVPRRVVGRVAAVLELADLVKFADLRPSPQDSRTAILEARAAIGTLEDALRPPPEPEPSAADAASNGEAAPEAAARPSS